MKNKVNKNKKVRIKLHMLFLFFSFVLLSIYIIYNILNQPISNIYIEGNIYISDQRIIEIAEIEKYPKTFKNSSFTIKKRLEDNKYIIKANVKKKSLTRIYIKIEENIPLFYNSLTEKTILKNGLEDTDIYDVPTLINAFPETLYKSLIKNMGILPYDVGRKISEIKYDPDNVDTERVLLTMTDGNYVYIAMSKFNLIYDYNTIIKEPEINNKKGILYLNAGGYFKVME